MFGKRGEDLGERVSDTPGIVLEGVTKTYENGFNAVKPTNLHINSGEFFSLLGSSGSGKTTMLKMISGLEFASTGRVTLDGIDITRMPANRRDVHTVFQNYALFPHMTVERNIGYGLEGQGVSKDEIARRVAEMIDLVDLHGHEADKPDELSGGMQQRVALARSLVLHPKALLLDEPLGALDLKLRHHMQDVLREVHAKVGITFIYVTHDQEEAFRMSDRIGVMTQGTLVQVSTPEELYNHPNTRFVADFVGDSNMVPGVVQQVINVERGIYRVAFDAFEDGFVVHGVPGLAEGVRVVGVLRPQDIRVSAPATAPYEMGLMRLRVDLRDRTFLGGYSKLALRSGDLDLVANVFSVEKGVSLDAPAVATWATDDLWVVAA